MEAGVGSATTAIRVVPTGGGVGAEVLGVDLRGVDDAAFAAVHRAWIAHGVLLFRGQRLTDEDLVGFSRRLGGLDLAPVQETGRRFVEGHPEIYVVSNVVVNGQPIGSLGAGEAVWHTDMPYLPAPPKASLLYALEVPPEGGDTWFCDMYSALDRLPAELRARVAGLRIKHDGTYNSGGYVRQGVVATDDPRLSPGTAHPVICRHPESLAARCCISGVAAMRGWSGSISPSPRRCWTRCGRASTIRRSPWPQVAGGRSGAVGQPLHDAPTRRF